jgi:hypothetical protein
MRAGLLRFVGPPPGLPYKHKKAKAGRKWRIAFRAGIPNHSADTPRELPGLLVNLSSRGPHITGATLPILWKSVIATVLGGQGDISTVSRERSDLTMTRGLRASGLGSFARK